MASLLNPWAVAVIGVVVLTAGLWERGRTQIPLAAELLSFIPLITQISVEAPDACWTPWALE